MTAPPSGTVTFLFTDIEGSTRRWDAQPEAMRRALARHDAILREQFAAHDGFVFKVVGDGFCAAFAAAPDALRAAVSAQRALASEGWAASVRMALHTGTADERDGDYFGPPLNRVARLRDAGHGGQMFASAATAELARESLPPGVMLRDLGEHRLRDLAHPLRIYQVVAAGLPDAFPPLRIADDYPSNLPPQLTSFVGRERELEAAVQLLRGVRLLTLTGAGGSGKTRLALAIAERLREAFPDGTFFVSLASIPPGVDGPVDLVLDAIAQALGVRVPEGSGAGDAVREYLRERRLLLVLDNFEHLLPAATVVSDLLGACPALSIVATSRAPLRISGERDFVVRPLAVPDPRALPPLAQLSQYEAVRLFIDRARAVRADFQVDNDAAPAVAAICHRLDGLPLAIELAAARIRHLSPQALLDRLEPVLPLLTGGPRDVPARQQTLRATIAWSYELLTTAERAVFRRLAVCIDGCDFEAATALTATSAAPQDGDALMDQFTSLADMSLLRQEELGHGEPRLRMLETVRAYGLEQLAATGDEAAARRRHAEHFLGLAERAEPELRRADQIRWFDRLECDYGNLRAAVAWSAAAGADAVIIGARLAAALLWFWRLRGHRDEGRSWVERLLPTLPPGAPASVRRRVLEAAAHLAAVQGDLVAARRHFEAMVAVARAAGEEESVGEMLAMLALEDGDAGRAREILNSTLAYRRRTGDDWNGALCLSALGELAQREGDMEAAAARHEESLAAWRAMGDRAGMALALNSLAELARRADDHGRARTLYEAAADLADQLGDRRELGQARLALGALDQVRDDQVGARSSFEASLAAFRDGGDDRNAGWALFSLAQTAIAQGDLVEARALLEQSLALGRASDDAGGIGASLTSLASIALEDDDFPRAGALAEEAVALYRREKRQDIAWSLNVLGDVARAQGDDDRAESIYREALALARVEDDPIGVGMVRCHLAAVQLRKGHRADALANLREGIALVRRPTARAGMLECLTVFATAAVDDDPARAARLLGAVDGQSTGVLRRSGADLREFEEVGARARRALGEEAFAAAYVEGRALSLDDAVALVLEQAERGTDPSPHQS